MPSAATAASTLAIGSHVRPGPGLGPVVGLVVSLALHALVIVLVAGRLVTGPPDRPARERTVIQLTLPPPVPESARPATRPEPPAAAPVPPVKPGPAATAPDRVATAPPDTSRPAASMAAPPAPTAEEWALAGRYTLRNSKAYRYTWGQQVRSMMGTAVEGPDQGLVRFRVEIAPDGSLARLETLWTTSPVAERLARQAIAGLPRWPATPTGKPLIFERTIAFTPFASDGPPLYRDDCLPERPAFSNPFVWDGQSVREPARARPVDAPDPVALEDCLKQLPPDSIDAEVARDKRLMDRWGWSASQPGR